MTPGMTIRERSRIRLRQLREDDAPRMAAGGFGGEEGAKRSYAQELEKPDGPPGADGKQLAGRSCCPESSSIRHGDNPCVQPS